ncbi:MAG TPA: tRNA-(ms[2]io[6]A)-hydroxylase [Chitinophagales bacterium]|nr:tRNA-(ms[2]io[6]A)-hydroxylase [Chitinophagales bacterium]HMZ34762.1 tRNA-(ms[2]io[6]A)-hydroxylase [Chitinophagales bacterium]HNA39860.1 tRNA-(ms[2]io[6]A)-hydroxylase [Chitinophagales bacterium]HNB49677.1 tRNA-(ms[2]io[6]A)-hydroxylase [Chitinophagales bacterium]HNC72443.1 tRNA-(ms[2]io[6]A)-hydroxylase [Chitinophagales bacterium]
MLGLKLATDPRWVNLASLSIEEILTDHAFCEQKATTNCISLIQLYPEKTFLVDKLIPIVNEEWSHFKMVHDELKKRNLKLGKQRQDKYVVALQNFIKKGGSPAERFLDRLLLAALIEARSCERFRLLSLDISDDSLKHFYHKLMISEATHYRLFIDIAEQYFEKEVVKSRWTEWLDEETRILSTLELRGDRIH